MENQGETNELPLDAQVSDLAKVGETNIPSDLLQGGFHDPEVVIAFVGAVGVDLKKAEEFTKERLSNLGYKVIDIKITEDVLPRLDKRASSKFSGEFERISLLMDYGNEARRKSGNDSILALGAAAEIKRRRTGIDKFNPRTAYIIHSLKHPAEVHKLREIYPRGFYLIGVQSEPKRRREYLHDRKKISDPDVKTLMQRDKKESDPHGQRIVDTFHLSDFFVRSSSNDDQIRYAITRFVEVMFGHPFWTPTFGEYAMYLAFSASLRSGDLSRQVGAVIAKDGEILSTGANECPAPLGGLYWPKLNGTSKKIEDVSAGRDWTRGYDSNRKSLRGLIDAVMSDLSGLSDDDSQKVRKALENSSIKDITEFGRVVHAEMEAILSCARKGVSTRGATIYCTTFPCHNCAKHIIASGIVRVVFVEPYLKSKALELHDDAIEISYPESDVEVRNIKKVQFEPFVGVGPRRYFDLFSMDGGVGAPLERKDSKTGKKVNWPSSRPSPRVRMLPKSYLGIEDEAAMVFERYCPKGP